MGKGQGLERRKQNVRGMERRTEQEQEGGHSFYCRMEKRKSKSGEREIAERNGEPKAKRVDDKRMSCDI